MHLVEERLKLQNKVDCNLYRIHVNGVICTVSVYSIIITYLIQSPNFLSWRVWCFSHEAQPQTLRLLAESESLQAEITDKTHPDHNRCQEGPMLHIPNLKLENSGYTWKVSEKFSTIIFKNDTNFIQFFFSEQWAL